MPKELTKERMDEIYKDMHEKMSLVVKERLIVEFEGNVKALLEKYADSMILEIGVIDRQAMELGIDTWGIFQAM